MTVYPLVPWVGFALVGFAAGPVLRQPLLHQRRVALATVGLCGVLFTGVRMFGGKWGNYRGRARGEHIPGLPWALDFFNVCKYPPSPAFVLLTMAVDTLLLVAFSYVALPPSPDPDAGPDAHPNPDPNLNQDCVLGPS